MKNKGFLKLLKKHKSNSGFTLTELLVGLIMSGIVVGALGFGLMQVLRTTKTETSKVNARSEAARALDFISDEVRRARTIDSNADNANDNDATDDGDFDETGLTVVFALDIPEINDGNSLDTDNDDTTSERIVYYLKSNAGTNWQGPLVLYRWGPPLDANGNYTNGAWQEEALIDKIDDTAVSSPCTGVGGTVSPVSPTGFYVCIDGDKTAQLFLTGETDTDTYNANTKVVARARQAPGDNNDGFSSFTVSYKTLKPRYACKSGTDWKMRTDFEHNSNATTWVRDPADDDRQPQPLKLNTNVDTTLTITSSPVGATGCNSLGNEYLPDDGDPNTALVPTTGDKDTEALSDYTHKISHTIDFNNPTTFNGRLKDDNHDAPTQDVIDVKGDKSVIILKPNSIIPDSAPYNNGYDANNDGDTDDSGDQKSLGEFLATEVSPPLAIQQVDGSYKIIGLNKDQRIVAVEIGQTDTSLPGFDMQDNLFVLTSKKFEDDFESSDFSP